MRGLGYDSRVQDELTLANGRVVTVTGVIAERTDCHHNTLEPFPDIAGRFQRAVADLRLAAARLGADAPLVLADRWARVFEEPDVFEHPIKTIGRWPAFVPPDGRETPPRWTCVVWLDSTPVETDDLGSTLVVGWFADAVADLDAEIVGAASKVDWKQHARGYSF